VTSVLGRTPTSARAETAHRLPRFRGLPSGRAVVGSALVVIAAAGVLSAHRAAATPPTTRVVVVTRDVPAGAVLEAADLGTVAVDLPAGTGAVSGDDAQEVIGSVARHDLREMDLLRPSDTGRPGSDPAPGSVVVPVEIERARALADRVHPGARVDVLATDPDGTGTQVLASDVLVVAVDDADDSLGARGGVGFRLALADAGTATAVVDAAVRSQLTLVLPTGPADPGAGRG
jgi:Flp pilus assembly protein CpaB